MFFNRVGWEHCVVGLLFGTCSRYKKNKATNKETMGVLVYYKIKKEERCWGAGGRKSCFQSRYFSMDWVAWINFPGIDLSQDSRNVWM